MRSMKTLKKINVELQNPNDFDSVPTEADCQKWVTAAVHKMDDSLSVVVRFVDDAESEALNNNYRQKKVPTNVLSFPFEEPSLLGVSGAQIIPELMNEPRHLGDLVLCEPLVLREATQQNKNPLSHWAHLIVHGTLHLQGFDHINDVEAVQMESLEIEILKGLGFDNPYDAK